MPKRESLGHSVEMWENVPVCIPRVGVWEPHLLHILTNICHFVAFILGGGGSVDVSNYGFN